MTRHIFITFIIALSFCISCKPSRTVSGHSPEQAVESDTLTEFTGEIIDQNLAKEKEQNLHGYRGSRERKFDLLHTSLDLQFDYDSQWVNGEARIIIKPYFFEQEILELDAKDFEIHEVWLEKGSATEPLDTSYDQRVLTVNLPKKYTANDTLRLGMRYTAMPNINSGMGSDAIAGDKGLYFINSDGTENKPVQIWTQGETEHNSKWFPTIDSPNERATHDIKLTVNDEYLTISNGRLESQTVNGNGTRTDHWVMDKPHAPYLTAIVVGDFAEISDVAGDIPLKYYVEKEFEEGAKKVFENTPEMMAFFSDLLGVEFPWQKYDQIVVRDFVAGAMENTTASIFMDALNLDEREAIDSEWDYIIAHELFHQWFGNLVTLESWANLPLNEAFADYSEYLWMEHQEGRDKADMHHVVAMENYFSEAGGKQVDMIRYYHNEGEDMFDHHSYAKGGRVLHMLRKYLGDKAFYASLNHYLTRHAFSSVEIHDLRLAFEKVTGKDLNWFFNQWFLASGHPVLDIHFDHSQPDNIVLTVQQEQDLATTPLYELPFMVSWYKGAKREERQFVLNQAVQQFALENGSGTDWVVFDEALELLANRQTYYGRDHFEKQAANAYYGIARYEALDSLSNNYPYDERMQATLQAALGDSFSSVRQLALAKIQANLDSLDLSAGDEEKILIMAEGDPENTVRSGAIELLNRIGKDKYAPLFSRLVNDSSYYVAGAALAASLENDDNQNRESLAERFLEINNIRIIVPLADYFTLQKKIEHHGWFDEKLEKLNGESLYYFLGYYGDYYITVAGTDKTKAINKISAIAKDHPASYVRFAAFQSLFGFFEEEGVLSTIRQIYEQETDETIKSYMEFYMDDLGE